MAGEVLFPSSSSSTHNTCIQALNVGISCIHMFWTDLLLFSDKAEEVVPNQAEGSKSWLHSAEIIESWNHRMLWVGRDL